MWFACQFNLIHVFRFVSVLEMINKIKVKKTFFKNRDVQCFAGCLMNESGIVSIKPLFIIDECQEMFS